MITRRQKNLLKTISSGNPCFLIGNGINRYKQNSNEGDISWEGLLLDIHNKFSSKSINYIPQGIALPEFYDIIDLIKDGKVKASLQKEFATKLEWQPKTHHYNIIKKVKELEAQILTTNFDFVLQKAAEANMYRYRVEGLRLLSDFYPWDSYFSDTEKKDPFNSFSIWHMHGQKNYHRSIKLGLNQYLLMVERAKKYFPDSIGQQNDTVRPYQTWVRLIFEKDLIILGLGLDEQEIFIRWLLLERAKYFKRHPELAKKAYYINHSENKNSNLGKRFFLKKLDVEFVDFIDDYDGFYDKFWSKL